MLTTLILTSLLFSEETTTTTTTITTTTTTTTDGTTTTIKTNTFTTTLDNSVFNNRFSVGVVGTVYGAPAGMLEFGVGLVKSGNFYMRNHIGIEGGAVFVDGSFLEVIDGETIYDYMGYLGFRDRIIFGGSIPTLSVAPPTYPHPIPIAMNIYGILDFGFLMIGGEGKKDITDTPFILDPRAGIGFETIYGAGIIAYSTFLEVLGGYKVFTTGGRVTSDVSAYVSIMFGARMYAN